MIPGFLTAVPLIIYPTMRVNSPTYSPIKASTKSRLETVSNCPSPVLVPNTFIHLLNLFNFKMSFMSLNSPQTLSVCLSFVLTTTPFLNFIPISISLRTKLQSRFSTKAQLNEVYTSFLALLVTVQYHLHTIAQRLLLNQKMNSSSGIIDLDIQLHQS